MLASMASPAAGVVVETVLAWRYGVSFVVDGFRVAYLLIAFGGALFFAQLMPNVIIPLFSEIRAKASDEEAWRFALWYGVVAGGALLLLSAWVWIAPGALFGFLGPGLSGAAQREGQLMLRYFIFSFSLMVWSGVMNGVLNAYQVFAVLPTAQFAANLVLAAAIAFWPPAGALPLIIGVAGGALVTVAAHVTALFSLANRLGISLPALLLPFPRERLMRAAWLSGPLVAMLAIQYYAVALYNRALSMLPAGSIAEYGYAWKMLTMANFVPTALATVVFSSLAAVAASPQGEIGRLFDRAVRMTLFLTIPPAGVLYIHRLDLVRLLLARGAMNAGDVQVIARLLGILLLSAPALAISGIVYKFLYAKQTTAIPAAINVAAAAVVFWLVPYAARNWGAPGVAAASSVCTWLTTLLACAGLAASNRSTTIRPLAAYMGRLTLVTGAAVAPGLLLLSWFANWNSLAVRLFVLALSGISAAGLVWGVSRRLRIDEADEVLAYALSRLPFLRRKVVFEPAGT